MFNKIVIIAILAGLLPALNAAREKAKNKNHSMRQSF